MEIYEILLMTNRLETVETLFCIIGVGYTPMCPFIAYHTPLSLPSLYFDCRSLCFSYVLFQAEKIASTF